MVDWEHLGISHQSAGESYWGKGHLHGFAYTGVCDPDQNKLFISTWLNSHLWLWGAFDLHLMEPQLGTGGWRGSSLLQRSAQYVHSRRCHFQTPSSSRCVNHQTYPGFLDLSQLSRASLLKAAVAALLLLLRWILAMVSEFFTTSMSPILFPVDKQPYGIIL